MLTRKTGSSQMRVRRLGQAGCVLVTAEDKIVTDIRTEEVREAANVCG